MRTPLVAGNWKMHLTPQEGVRWVDALVAELGPGGPPANVEAWAFPAFPALPAVITAAASTLPSLRIGAQNVHAQTHGAFTGDVSAAMLTAVGAGGVLVGHSERRAGGETDADVRAKLQAAEAAGLAVIVCVGEALPTREIGAAEAWVSIQIRAALAGRTPVDPARVAVAYEPIWAIGTGKSASGAQANAIIGSIRAILAELYGHAHAEAMRIQYGGSVKPGNMAEFMSQPHIDGALVGGASLQEDSFVDLVRIAIEAKGLA